MEGKTKKILIVLLVIIVIGMIGCFGYQYYKREAPEKGDKAEKIESRKEVVIKELTEKYDALTGWNKDIRYTIQLQNLLVNSDKPVLFTGSVDDIFMKDDQYYIRFISGSWWGWGLEFFEKQVYFVLKCDSNKVSEVINRETKGDSVGDYVVVAKIENVTKPILQISSYPVGSEEVELEYEPSTTFIATGTCIGFVYIEEDDDNQFNE